MTDEEKRTVLQRIIAGLKSDSESNTDVEERTVAEAQIKALTRQLSFLGPSNEPDANGPVTRKKKP